MSNIYNTENNWIVFGLCSNIAKKLNLDVELVRTLWALTTLYYGIGLVLYVICAHIFSME